MKKLLILFAMFCSVIFNADTSFAAGEITFLYFNGSNTNDEKTKEWFYSGINKFHPILKKTLENDPLTASKMLRGYTIADSPSYIYWGNMSEKEIQSLQEKIELLNFKSPKMAQLTRKYIALCFHDAIWISKFTHMFPMLDMTHQKVMEEYEKGNKVVFLGYSAGSFITYQYFLIKLPIINMAELASVNSEKNNRDYAQAIVDVNPQPTCVDAIFRAKVVSFDIYGNIDANNNIDDFKKNLTKIDDYTKLYCTPKDAVIGVINYASPLSLFYSELGNPTYLFSEINIFMYKYLVENGLFWLTVNYSDDPLGFPVAKRVNLNEMIAKTGIPINQGEGVLYDRSETSSHRTFIKAHTSYWSTGKRFAKNILKAYKDGYEYFKNAI